MMMATTTTTTNTEENQSRDAYGFAISKENKQPKDWKEVLRKEEEERQVAWYEFYAGRRWYDATDAR